MCYTCLTCLFTGGQRTCENFKADKNETETLNSINRNYVKALQCHRVSVTKHFNKSQHSCHKCHNTGSSVTQLLYCLISLIHLEISVWVMQTYWFPNVPHIAIVVVCSVATQLKGWRSLPSSSWVTIDLQWKVDVFHSCRVYASANSPMK